MLSPCSCRCTFAKFAVSKWWQIRPFYTTPAFTKHLASALHNSNVWMLTSYPEMLYLDSKKCTLFGCTHLPAACLSDMLHACPVLARKTLNKPWPW